MLVISVQGSKIVSNPNNKAVKICTINSLSTKNGCKISEKFLITQVTAIIFHEILHISKYFTTFTA